MMRNHTLSYIFLLTQTLWLFCPTERMYSATFSTRLEHKKYSSPLIRMMSLQDNDEMYI